MSKEKRGNQSHKREGQKERVCRDGKKIRESELERRAWRVENKGWSVEKKEKCKEEATQGREY